MQTERMGGGLSPLSHPKHSHSLSVLKYHEMLCMGENPSEDHPLRLIWKEAKTHIQEEGKAKGTWQPHFYTVSIIARMIARQIKIASKFKDESDILRELDFFRSPSCPKVSFIPFSLSLSSLSLAIKV